MNNHKTGYLLGGAPGGAKMYNPETKKAMLAPGVPLGLISELNEVNGVGIIDSGVFSEHPQLKGLVLAEKSFVGDDPSDDIGHGTAVALQFLRSVDFSLPYPAIFSAKVTNEYGEPNVDAVINAIHWVVSKGALIINLSLGFKGEAEDFTQLCEVISSYNGVIFYAAAGNFGKDVKIYPAACVGRIVSVAESRGGKIVKSSGVGKVSSSSDNAFFVEDWNYYMLGGLTEMKLSNYEKAAVLFNKSLEYKRNVEALFQIALIYLKTDKPGQSISLLDEAISLESGLMTLYVHKGAAMQMLERYEEAEKLFLTVLAVNEDDQMALYNIVITLESMKHYNEALQYIRKLQSVNPNYPGADRVLSRLTKYKL